MKKIDKPLYENLGKQLKAARLAKGYSLEDVANVVGKSKASIKRYEDAAIRIDMDTLDKLCKFLNINMLDFTSLIYEGGHDNARIFASGDSLEQMIDLHYFEKNKIKFYEGVRDDLFEAFMFTSKETKIAILTLLKIEDKDNLYEKLTEGYYEVDDNA